MTNVIKILGKEIRKIFVWKSRVKECLIPIISGALQFRVIEVRLYSKIYFRIPLNSMWLPTVISSDKYNIHMGLLLEFTLVQHKIKNGKP